MRFKYILLLFFGLILVLFYFNVNPTEVNFLPKCPLYATTGIYCPGCGSQRATHYLLHFNFMGAMRQNVLYLLALILLGYHALTLLANKLFKKQYHSILNYKKTPIIILILVIIFWVLRNLPWEPFNLLAPHI